MEIYNLNSEVNLGLVISKMLKQHFWTMVAENPNATLVELCELFAAKTGNWVSRSAMSSSLQKIRLNRKKKTMRSSQAATERVQKLRLEYWEKVNDIEQENLVFIDETGVRHWFGKNSCPFTTWNKSRRFKTV